MGPSKFRKRPVVIEAMEYRHDPEGTEMVVAGWCDGRIRTTDPTQDDGYWMEIETLEGTMCADQGDWIIKGVAGEFYPCKPDIGSAAAAAAKRPSCHRGVNGASVMSDQPRAFRNGSAPTRH